MLAIEQRLPRVTKMNIKEKKNLIRYEDVAAASGAGIGAGAGAGSGVGSVYVSSSFNKYFKLPFFAQRLLLLTKVGKRGGLR